MTQTIDLSKMRKSIEKYLRENGPTSEYTIMDRVDSSGAPSRDVKLMLETMCLQGQVNYDLFSLTYSLFSEDPAPPGT